MPRLTARGEVRLRGLRDIVNFVNFPAATRVPEGAQVILSLPFWCDFRVTFGALAQLGER